MFVNISAYKFITLDKLATLRADIDKACQRHAIKGTILLAEEGVNINLTGLRDDIDAIISYLHAIPGFEDLPFKESLSEKCPFHRIKIRIRPEIITMGDPDVKPEQGTAPHLPAAQFKQWLDEQRDITVLDTRNRYEIEFGSFTDAIDLGIDNFSDFPEAVSKLDNDLKEKPLVMFCTGGVRCEKAAVAMRKQGYSQVYQLDGGILKYFEEAGGAHYTGDCFVFDDRIAVNPALEVVEQKSV